MNAPNLFSLATKELSQDAFLAWLLQWGDPAHASVDPYLHELAVSFIRSLAGKDKGYQIHSVQAGRQWKNIDVWAFVNDELCLVIEDKKGTKEHSNQLTRYREFAAKEKPKMELSCIYVKFEEQSDLSAVRAANYSVFDRESMIALLNKYLSSTPLEKQNNIISDFFDYLTELHNAINSYQVLPLDKWGWYAWQGFFSTIQKELGTGRWGYVANPAGGFQGYWWHTRRFEGSDFSFNGYLQLEQDQLIFKQKVDGSDSDGRRVARNFYRKCLKRAASDTGISIEKYGRLGKHMGVARLTDGYRVVKDDGLLDLPATVAKLRGMMNLLDSVDFNP